MALTFLLLVQGGHLELASGTGALLLNSSGAPDPGAPTIAGGLPRRHYPTLAELIQELEAEREQQEWEALSRQITKTGLARLVRGLDPYEMPAHQRALYVRLKKVRAHVELQNILMDLPEKVPGRSWKDILNRKRDSGPS